MIFKDRSQAGLLLAKKLKSIKDKKTLVLAIPRGGVVIAKAIAENLQVPLDLIVIKKIGAPSTPELAIGAVGPPSLPSRLGRSEADGEAGPMKTTYWDEELCQKLGISNRIKNRELRIKEKEREAKEKILLKGKRHKSLKNKTIILADDGVATGATVLAAQKYLKTQKINKLILATPVISKETLSNIKKYFDTIVVLSIEENFMAVGQFYLDFPQVSDEEVIDIIK